MAARYYGAIREKFNARDYIKVYKYVQAKPKVNVVAKGRDLQQKTLKDYVPQVYDQGKLNSCTANAFCAAYTLELRKQESTTGGKGIYFDPSRLFLYYNTRRSRGTTQEDSGATLHETIEAFVDKGVCTESLWPYIVQKFSIEPDKPACEAARVKPIQSDRLVQDVQTLKVCLDKHSPFVFGFSMYNRCFDEAGKSGILPLPTQEEKSKPPDGFHTVMAVEYSEEKKAFLVLNSYGPEWGKDGYFYMPYQFIIDSDMCFDFWAITFDSDRKSHINLVPTWLPWMTMLTPVFLYLAYIQVRTKILK